MAASEPKLCVMVLCGLPASGKTSLAKTLVQSAKGPLSFIIVEYDKLLPADIEKYLIEGDTDTGASVGDFNSFEDSSSQWKQYRSDIYQCVDALLGHLKEADVKDELNVISPQNVSTVLWNSFLRKVTEQQLVRESVSKDMCVVVDDNMYYRSMRHRYYQLARKYSVGFCQVYMKCNIDDAQARNSSRDMSVHDSVIQTMAARFEAPDSRNNSWENLSLTVPMSDVNLQDIYHLIQQALESPVPPVQEEDQEALNQSRQICSDNFLYQSDQILRRLVSQEMAVAKENKLSKSVMRDLASGLQTTRKQILEGLKSSRITVPTSVLALVTDASRDPDSGVFDFLKQLFQQHHDIR